jgi:hypothetical protein
MTPELTTADVAAAASARERERMQRAEPPPAPHDENGTVAMYSEDQLRDFRSRWDQMQAGFVDEPRGAVERADGLVAEAISKLADGFARTRGQLEEQWKRGDQVSTEDLRQALRHYRSFFTRLLNT